MSRAAWDLQCRATAHTAFCGHPGFVPDDYLQHLDGLHLETTITAAELCTSGMWERVGGRYRVLDWEAVEACLDQVRQARGEDPQALAWEREREAQVRARMTRPMVVTPPCAVCGTPSVPSSWWGPEAPACRVGAVARHCAGQHRPAARAGTVVSAVPGHRCLQWLRQPHRRHQGRTDRLGVPASPVRRPGPHGRVLPRCGILPGLRCSLLLPALARLRHWVRVLPRGHGKSLDPHWSPLPVDFQRHQKRPREPFTGSFEPCGGPYRVLSYE
jgi:hypothetical protein